MVVSTEIQENCSLSSIGVRHTSVEFGGLESSNEKLWKETNQENVNIEIRWHKFRWIGHTLRKSVQEPCKAAPMWNPQGSREREEGQGTAGREAH
jgi:hypothetical protein